MTLNDDVMADFRFMLRWCNFREGKNLPLGVIKGSFFSRFSILQLKRFPRTGIGFPPHSPS